MSANQPLTVLTAPQVDPAKPGWRTRETALSGQLAAYLLPVATAIIYLLFPTKNYYWDGISFADAIENSSGLTSNLIHPHHLLYNVFGYLLYSIAQGAGWQARAVQVLQISNSIISVFCALLLFRFLRRSLQSRAIAVLMVAAFSFSATWWKFSTDADSYIPSIFLLLVCLNLLLAVERLKPFLLAAVHSASMCLHQLAVFFFPVALAGILLRSEYDWRKRIRLALSYSATASIATLAINYICFHWQTGAFGLDRFARWLTAYLQGPDRYSFSFNLLSNIKYTLRGEVRLFFEGRLSWLKGFLSLPVILLITLLVGLVIVLLVSSVRALLKTKFRLRFPTFASSPFRPLIIVNTVWIGSYLLFLFFWYPYFTPYRLFYLVPIVVLGGVYLVHRRRLDSRHARLTAAMFVAAMAISNFVFFILPLSYAENFPPLSFALEMNQTFPEKSVVYYAQSNADNRIIKYFNPSTNWKMLRSDPGDSFGMESSDLNGSDDAVWLETSAISQLNSSPEGARWLAAHSSPGCQKELINRHYNIKFLRLLPASLSESQINCQADSPRMKVLSNRVFLAGSELSRLAEVIASGAIRYE